MLVLLVYSVPFYAQEYVPVMKVEDRLEAIKDQNVAYQWSEMAILGTANDTDRIAPRPTVTSRFLALVFVAVFDAWSAFDDAAIPVYMEAYDKFPGDKQTLANKEKAISYAAYHTLREYYPYDSLQFKKFMLHLGYDPNDDSLDPTTPAGIGNLAAQATIKARYNDGSNQYGEVEGFSKPYQDYTLLDLQLKLWWL